MLYRLFSMKLSNSRVASWALLRASVNWVLLADIRMCVLFVLMLTPPYLLRHSLYHIHHVGGECWRIPAQRAGMR